MSGKPEAFRLQCLEEPAWIALLLLTLAVSAWVHACAGLTLPLPWDDEVSFLWPAVNLAGHNTLFAPELNPDRPVFWMPPGFMVACGLAFKLTGFSLMTARWVSWLILAGAYVTAAIWFRRFPLRLVSLALWSLFFLNGAFVAAGNIGRMDGLCLLLACAGFLLIQDRRLWPGLALLALDPLVHPNGVYFFGAGLVAAAIWVPWREWRPAARDGVLLAIVAAAWLFYAWHVWGHVDAFLMEMRAQMARKAGRRPLERLVAWPIPAYFAGFVASGLVAMFRRSRFACPLAFGGTCLVIKVTGVEMWYEIFNGMALLVLGLSSLWFLAQGVVRVWPGRRFVRSAAIAMVALPLLVFYHRHGFVEGPRGYPSDLTWGWGMRMAGGTPYLTVADRQAVLQELDAVLETGRFSRVEFYPRGDALLFWNDLRDRMIPFEPHFTTNRGDYLVYRTSRHIPAWMSNSVGQAAARLPASLQPFHIRSDTEAWYLVDLRAQRVGVGPSARASQASALILPPAAVAQPSGRRTTASLMTGN